MGNILENIQEVIIEKPADIIIKQIKELLSTGQIKPGDKLPSERKLAEKFGVGRTYVRDAIKKLEFYGILRTLPQSGTVVSGMNITALDGLITDVLQLDSYDFFSVAEMRLLLEQSAARLCALRRTDEDIRLLEQALDAYEDKLHSSELAIEEDFAFHRQIAEGSKNLVVKSMMMIITPDIMSNYHNSRMCSTDKSRAILEHRLLLEYIKNRDSSSAEDTMSLHLKKFMEYAESQKDRTTLIR